MIQMKYAMVGIKAMNKRQNGFSIVELIVVISLLGILAAISFPHFKNANMLARGSKILADMNACESAVNIYYVRTGSFPADIDALIPSYMATRPKPPTGSSLIKKHDNNELIVDVKATGYIYSMPETGSELTTRIGRITLGGMTIDEILSTSESSLTLSDG